MRSGPDQRSRRRYNGNKPFQQQQRGPQHHQTLDSSGPNLKIRGNARQIFEKYVALAREAAAGGDPIAAENFYQHAEHYFRIDKASRDSIPQAAPPPIALADATVDGAEQDSSETGVERSLPGWGDDRPGPP